MCTVWYQGPVSCIPSKDILGNAFVEKQGTWKWQWKEDTETNSGLTIDNLNLFTSNSYYYRGWKGALTSSHSTGKTNPSTSWLKVPNSDHWPQNGKQIVWCVFHKRQTRRRINVQSAKWCFVLTWIQFKCWNCNIGSCFDPCLRMFHTKSQFSYQHFTGKSWLHKCKYHYAWIFFEYRCILYKKGKGVWIL
jgi:hypothetical protein